MVLVSAFEGEKKGRFKGKKKKKILYHMKMLWENDKKNSINLLTLYSGLFQKLIPVWFRPVIGSSSVSLEHNFFFLNLESREERKFCSSFSSHGDYLLVTSLSRSYNVRIYVSHLDCYSNEFALR